MYGLRHTYARTPCPRCPRRLLNPSPRWPRVIGPILAVKPWTLSPYPRDPRGPRGEPAIPVPVQFSISNARRFRLRTVGDCVDKLLRLATARPWLSSSTHLYLARVRNSRNVARGLSTAAETPCVITTKKCRKNVPLKHIDRSSSMMHVIYRVAQKINPTT